MLAILTSRIKLFAFIGFIVILFMIPLVAFAGDRNLSIQNETIRINPEIKIKRLSNGDVIANVKRPSRCRCEPSV